MRIFLTILFLHALSGFATTYYVANAGNNSNNGTTTGTPFQTITKALSVVVAGDNILLNKGDTWNERIVPITSGTVGNVITIGTYGTGNNPIVTALTNVTGWANVSGNLWSTSVPTSVLKQNTVLVNGSIIHKSRTPNNGYYTFTSYSGLFQITGTLSGTPNYAGYECVVRSAPWCLDVVKIASQSGGALNFRDSLTYPAGQWGGNGYFIQNNVPDTLGEYRYDSTNKIMYVYSLASPTNVQISNTDTLVWLSKKSYLIFNGISFTGANVNQFQFDTCTNITVQNCNINNSGAVAFNALKSSHINIINDSVQNSLSGAVYFRNVGLPNSTLNTCDTAFINGNYFYNTGIFAGMGMSGNERYFTINTVGLNTTITNNLIRNSGYIPISYNGKNTLIKYNLIDSFAFVKDDAGGIYTYRDVWFPNYPNDSSVVMNNIIQNGIGAKVGSVFPTGQASGLYLDDSVSNVRLDSNSVSNCVTAGLFIHNANNIIARFNNLYNNATQIYLSGTATKVFNNIVRFNQLFANSGQSMTNRDYYDTNEKIDSNYLSRWPTEGNYMVNQTSNLSLTIWRNGTGWDRNSGVTPVNITYDPVLYYTNPTPLPTTITNGFTYTDLFGNSANSFTLAPYQSIILFKALNQYVPPVPPGKTTSNLLPIKIIQK